MAKKFLLIAGITLLLLALTGCTPDQGEFQMATQAPAGAAAQATATPTTEPDETDWDNLGYDPTGEESGDIPDDLYNDGNEQGGEAVQATYYAYAGATPMPLDPLDMPTGTPKPALPSFTYQTYNATKLGLTFEGPAGWIIDDSSSDTFTLTQPESEVRDNYQAYLTIKVASTGKTYSSTDLKTEVKGMLSTIGEKNYSKWEPSSTATRKILGAEGIYANYAGTLVDGTRVRGRVQAVYVDNKLITFHLSDPADYNSDYMTNVYGKMEQTLKFQ